MKASYENLGDLLYHDSRAEEYFYSLPDSIQRILCEYPQSVNSLENLQYYGNNLLHGEP